MTANRNLTTKEMHVIGTYHLLFNLQNVTYYNTGKTALPGIWGFCEDFVKPLNVKLCLTVVSSKSDDKIDKQLTHRA